MREGSEVKNGEQEKNGNPINQSINQSSVLHLVQNENLKRLLGGNPGLKREYDKTMELIDILKKKPKIKTLDELNDCFQKIGTVEGLTNISDEYHKVKLFLECKQNNDDQNTVCNIEEQMKNMLPVDHYIKCLNESNSENEIRSQLKHIRWIQIAELIGRYLTHLYDNRFESQYLMDDYASIEKLLLDKFNTLNNLQSRNRFSMNFYVHIQKLCNKLYLKLFSSDAFKKYIKSGFYDIKFSDLSNGFMEFADSQLIIILLENSERYNFFLQWHKILENNLPQKNKQLFYNYLSSCKNKLQIERNRYNYFYEREWVLTAILVFGSIASAIVLTIYFMEIYVATWFFWFGIVGVILTVAVGICLFLCLKENYNEIKSIDRAIDVYDLDKIRNFKESEPKKISMLENDKNENKIINGQTKEINTDDPSNAPKLKPINTGQDINKNNE